MTNLWHTLEAGPDIPDSIYVLVEIPKGSRSKYEYDKHMGILKLDRVLYASLHYPGAYGFIPQTLAGDDDPLDVLVMTEEATFPGCLIEAHPIGLFKMLDQGVVDDKILAVPATDPLFHGYGDIDDIPPHFLREVAHFFSVYKDLEGKRVEPIGWEHAEIAKQEIMQALARYRTLYG